MAPVVPKGWATPAQEPGVGLMCKLRCAVPVAALLAFASIIGADVRSAELEGALQYPPLSVGEDAQPPPLARMLPQPVSPLRIELGVSGSSTPPGTLRFYIRPPLHLEPRGAAYPNGFGG
ncbi:MAG: hypothetical protein WA633_23800 [Stellaceae bacterium]